MSRLRVTAALALLAAALRVILGPGLVNYDTLYTLVWGRDLAHGRLPDYDVALAPTPHPIATLAGALITSVGGLADGALAGQTALEITLALAYVALAALGFVVYRLGAAWFHPAVGVLAAAIVLTRRPFLDFGARAYVDIPYLVLILGAVLVETRRPRAGAPVLALLGVAGLIRPEAWLLSGAYVLWTREWRLLWLAAAAPVLWALSDLAVTGNPLHSLTGTRENAATLERVTGIQNVPLTVPRRLGEILREPVLLGAAGGGLLSLLWLRERTTIRLAVAVGVLGLAAFTVLATAGLPILGRYLLLPATMLAIFGAAGVLGWLTLPPEDPRRRPWQAFGVLTALALLAFAPAQVDRIRGERDALAIQDRIQDDLGDLAAGPVPLAQLDGCPVVTVPNRRPIPLLALWLDQPLSSIRSAQDGVPAQGLYLRPATAKVAQDYILDPRDLDQSVPGPPSGSEPLARNPSWVLDGRCE